MKRHTEGTSMLDEVRVPPSNDDAERAILGAVLIEAGALATVQDDLSTWMFYHSKHQDIFAAMITLTVEGHPIDTITLAEQLRADGLLEKVGGASYLAELIADVATAANVKHHAHLVKEAALRRRIRELGMASIRRSEDPSVTVTELIEETSRELCQLAQGSSGDGFVDLPTVYIETLSDVQEQAHKQQSLSGITTGFTELDLLTGGFQPGDLVVIAARPSMGKTALALCMAMAASDAGHSVAIFSLEMSRKALGMRLLGAKASIDIHTLKTGRLTHVEWSKLAAAAHEVSPGMIHINDGAIRTMVQIHAQARRLKTAKRLDLVIVDYIQMLDSPSRNRRDTRQQEVSDMSRSLKLLAMELQVPVIALSQLNRKVEDRQDKRPMLSDLRESGAIEQDADLVMCIYRDEVYEPTTDAKGIAEILVRKHRNGSVGMWKLKFTDRYARFEDLPEDQR